MGAHGGGYQRIRSGRWPARERAGMAASLVRIRRAYPRVGPRPASPGGQAVDSVARPDFRASVFRYMVEPRGGMASLGAAGHPCRFATRNWWKTCPPYLCG